MVLLCFACSLHGGVKLREVSGVGCQCAMSEINTQG